MEEENRQTQILMKDIQDALSQINLRGGPKAWNGRGYDGYIQGYS